MGIAQSWSMGKSCQRKRAANVLLAGLLVAGVCAPLNAQNILVNEFSRAPGSLTAAGDEWMEIVLAEPLTAARLNEYLVGDSQAARTSKFGALQFTGMEGIAENFPAGTLIVVAGGNAGLTEDLSYNPGGGDWNLTFVLNSPYLTSVGGGSIDFAGDDVAWVDRTATGMITGDGFGVTWRTTVAGGPLAESANVGLTTAPANSVDTSLQTLGNDYLSDSDVFWITEVSTPGQPNDNDSNGAWINGLRAGTPSGSPLIRVSEKQLEYGTVLDDVFPLPALTIEVRNSALASNNLNITGFAVEPNDLNFRVVPPTPATPFNVAPGATQVVTIEFDPLGTPGEYAATLVISHNDGNRDPKRVKLTGRALSSTVPAAFTGTLPSVYEEDFDTLPNLEQFVTEAEGDFADPYPWSDNATLASWYASQALNPPVTGIFASTGADSNPFAAMSSGMYSFGQDAVAERALGSVAGTSTGTLYFGLRLLNDTGVTIPSIQVEYIGEQWRLANNTSAHKLEFSYAISDEPFLTAPVSNDGFTAVPTLDFISPQVGATQSPLDGNDPANQVAFDVTIQGVDLLPGQEIFLRWLDINDGGVDHGLAIDDVRVTALPPTVPAINFDAALATFLAEINVASAPQSYTVSGENLVGSVFVAPPAGFEVSLSSGGPWTANPATIELTQSGGVLAATTVFARAAASATSGPVSGNIVHSTSGAGDQVVAVTGIVAPGPLVLTAVDVAETENFDTLGSVAAAPLPDGFSLSGGTISAANLTYQTGNSAGNTGTGSLTGTSGGNAYNFGDGVNAEATDRAVGFLTSGSFSSPRNIILTMLNNTGSQINELDVAFDIEKYRSGSRAFGFRLYVGTSLNSWTEVPEASQDFPADANNNSIFSPALTFPQEATISGLSVNPGQRVYLRWEHIGAGGSTNGQALALDDLSVTPRGVPVEPGELGDVNGDGLINVADVTVLANLLAAGTPPPPAVGDANGDGSVTQADVETLAVAIANGSDLPLD